MVEQQHRVVEELKSQLEDAHPAGGGGELLILLLLLIPAHQCVPGTAMCLPYYDLLDVPANFNGRGICACDLLLMLLLLAGEPAGRAGGPLQDAAGDAGPTPP